MPVEFNILHFQKNIVHPYKDDIVTNLTPLYHTAKTLCKGSKQHKINES